MSDIERVRADGRDEREDPQVVRLVGGAGRVVTLIADGLPLGCWEGDSVATALLATRRWIADDGVRKRGIFCGVGICFECVVMIDGVPVSRSCLTEVREGMRITTRAGGVR